MNYELIPHTPTTASKFSVLYLIKTKTAPIFFKKRYFINPIQLINQSI